MGFKIKINDYDISELVIVTNVVRGGSPGRVYRQVEFPNGNGGTLSHGRFEMRKMAVEFRMHGDIDVKKDKLLKILPIFEEKKIVFEDEPNRYYLVKMVGSLVFEKRNSHNAIGSFELIAEDPIAFSVEKKNATRVRNVLTFNNEGTSECYPIFKFTPQHDLKMFALVHPSGKAIQIGSESSKVVFPRNVPVVIDTYKREVLVGGAEKQINHASNWFNIKANTTTEIIYTVNRDATLPAVNSDYKERWL